jgi:hypothetical protein
LAADQAEDTRDVIERGVGKGKGNRSREQEWREMREWKEKRWSWREKRSEEKGRWEDRGTATEEESKDWGDILIENPQRQGPTQPNQ